MTDMQPRANLGGICRQPIRPGSWQGFKAASKNINYIQNNFFGSSIFGANRNMVYGHQCYRDYPSNNVPGWMKWVTGIGLGAQLLGGILKLFQKDKPAEAGGEDSSVQNQNQTPVQQQTQNPAQEVDPSQSEDGGSDNNVNNGNNGNNGNTVNSNVNQNQQTPAHLNSTAENNDGVNTKFGWYETGKDSHTGRFQGCKNVEDITSALANTKTINDETAKTSPNQHFINNNKAAIQKAIIAANPGMFEPNGDIKPGADINKIKIPDMQWIADTYGNGTKAASGNGRTVKRNAQTGKSETYSKDGQKLKDSYVNAKTYNVTKGGKKYQVKVSPDGKEKWYYDQNGKAISEKEFHSLTGLTGNQVLEKAKKKAPPKTTSANAQPSTSPKGFGRTQWQ